MTRLKEEEEIEMKEESILELCGNTIPVVDVLYFDKYFEANISLKHIHISIHETE